MKIRYNIRLKINITSMKRILIMTQLMFFLISAYAQKKTNIILILADDLGWADLPSYGNDFNEAPNISKMADEGMQFNQAYAACPVCSPTRASIMSGQYPARVGVIDFIPGHWRPYEKVTPPSNRTQYLPLEVKTIAETLKDAGYATALYGKWHLGYAAEHHPSNHGFDDAVMGAGFYNVKYTPERKSSKLRMSEQITEWSLEFIEKHKDDPFFLVVSHFDVHVLLDADQPIIDKYLAKPKSPTYPSNAIYAAMIEHLDNSVGQINDKLKSLGIDENTMVVFFSDNGGMEGRFDGQIVVSPSKAHIYAERSNNYVATSNKPLSGEKGNLYEGGIREPLIIKWPKRISAGTKSDALISSVDLYPTFVACAGGKMPKKQVADGYSVLPILTGDSTSINRSLYWHYPVYHHGVPGSAVRMGEYKLIHNLQDDIYELYNINNDISETNNLINQKPDIAEKLKITLQKWHKCTGAEMPKPNPAFDETKRNELGAHPDRKEVLKHRKK